MKLVKKIAAVTLAGALAVCALAMAGCGAKTGTLVKSGTLTVLTNAEYEPFEYYDGDDMVGYDIDLIKKVAEKLNLKIEIVNMDFDALIPALASGSKGDVVIAGMSVDPERKELVSFTNNYYVDNMAVAMLTADKDQFSALNSAGKKIAVQRGTTGEDWAKENFPLATIVPFSATSDCFAAVVAGKADAVCTNASVVNSMISATFSQFSVVDTEATDEAYAIAVNKSNTDLLESINKVLEELQKDGTLTKLGTTWEV